MRRRNPPTRMWRLSFNPESTDIVLASDPTTWSSPEEAHPDLDLHWEVPHLRVLAIELVTKANVEVSLDLSDSTCACFSIARAGVKIGEAFVNRDKHSAPLFSVYLGADQAEHHVASTAAIVDHVSNTTDEWPLE